MKYLVIMVDGYSERAFVPAKRALNTRNAALKYVEGWVKGEDISTLEQYGHASFNIYEVNILQVPDVIEDGRTLETSKEA